MQLTPKSASVVPTEDGRLTPETCRRLRHNKVFVKVKVYYVGYAIVMISQVMTTQSNTAVNCMSYDKCTNTVKIVSERDVKLVGCKL
jgi:hypothetical protein